MSKLDATPEGPAESLAFRAGRGICATRACYYFCKLRPEVSPHPPPHPRGPGATTGLPDLEVQGYGQTQDQTPLSAGQRGRRRASSGGHWGAAAAGSPRGSGAAAKAEALSSLGLERGARRGNHFASFVAQASVAGMGYGAGTKSVLIRDLAVSAFHRGARGERSKDPGSSEQQRWASL